MKSSVSGRRLPISRVAGAAGGSDRAPSERREALISVTFLGRDFLRRLNAEHKGHDRPTDVLTFALTEPAGHVVGDVYVCPWMARQGSWRAGHFFARRS